MACELFLMSSAKPKLQQQISYIHLPSKKKVFVKIEVLKNLLK